MKNLTFADLIDVNSLQMIQDSFAKYTDMVLCVTDTEGNPVTEQSGNSDFCDYIKFNSTEGRKRCKECELERTRMACENRDVVFYTCHAGLADYSVPILFEGRVISVIHAGQVITGEYKDAGALKEMASEFSLPPDEFLLISKRITKIAKDDAEKTAYFLMEFSKAISVLAYENYKKIEVSRHMESAARSQASYVTDMTEELRVSMKDWLDFFKATTDKYKDMPEVIAETSAILNKGQEVYSVIDGVVDYIHLSGGNVEYSETIYDVRTLVNDAINAVRNDAGCANISVESILDDSLPGLLLGNSGRIGQVLTNICKGSVAKTTNGGSLTVKASCAEGVYSSELNLEITCMGTSVDHKTERVVKKMMKGAASDAFKYEERKNPEEAGLPMIVFLVKQMAGSLDFESLGEDGVVIRLSVPQLNCDKKDAQAG